MGDDRVTRDRVPEAGEASGVVADELDELAHAYAVTIHRSQGSEYPAVVLVVGVRSVELSRLPALS